MSDLALKNEVDYRLAVSTMKKPAPPIFMKNAKLVMRVCNGNVVSIHAAGYESLFESGQGIIKSRYVVGFPESLKFEAGWLSDGVFVAWVG